MFDPIQYWKNRKAGKRGQGEEPKSKVVATGFGTNRASYRKKVRATDKDNKPFTSKGVVHKNGSKPFTPSQDPSVPNKVRVANQRLRRKESGNGGNNRRWKKSSSEESS